MVHHRLNENETNPNPHINFISALKSDPGDHEDARQLLRALAAQVRPVMKAHGFSVNSFEEVQLLDLEESTVTNLFLEVRIQPRICWKELEPRGNCGCVVLGGPRKQTAQSCLELVLRRADGTFCPMYWLMSTLCHEVRQIYPFFPRNTTYTTVAGSYQGIITAISLRVDSQTHSQHMDHGPAFQALWSRLRAEVRRLQDRGYYGDGQDKDAPCL